MPISQNYHILTKFKSGLKYVQVIMTEISEEEENLIDNLERNVFKIDRGDRTFSITNNQIYCYGEVNFNSEEDLKTIDNFSFLNHLKETGVPIWVNYNYETHTSDHPKYTETWSPAELAKYAHGCLNKPKRIILFKHN